MRGLAVGLLLALLASGCADEAPQGAAGCAFPR